MPIASYIVDTSAVVAVKKMDGSDEDADRWDGGRVKGRVPTMTVPGKARMCEECASDGGYVTNR